MFIEKRTWRSYRSALVARAAQAINILLLRSKDGESSSLLSKEQPPIAIQIDSGRGHPEA